MFEKHILTKIFVIAYSIAYVEIENIHKCFHLIELIETAAVLLCLCVVLLISNRVYGNILLHICIFCCYFDILEISHKKRILSFIVYSNTRIVFLFGFIRFLIHLNKQ